MKAYQMKLPGGFLIKSYGDGLMMIKAANRTSGRCLFFSSAMEAGTEILTALLGYKKETDEVPKQVLDTARARLRKVREG
jgi:hypothetical protein